jgi:hypothetical protein
VDHFLAGAGHHDHQQPTLGHHSPEATRVYAKVDLNSLRLVGEFELEGLL